MDEVKRMIFILCRSAPLQDPNPLHLQGVITMIYEHLYYTAAAECTDNDKKKVWQYVRTVPGFGLDKDVLYPTTWCSERWSPCAPQHPAAWTHEANKNTIYVRDVSTGMVAPYKMYVVREGEGPPKRARTHPVDPSPDVNMDDYSYGIYPQDL